MCIEKLDGDRVSICPDAMIVLQIAKAIHYPDCWNTVAYPTLALALDEMYVWFKCQTCEAAPDAGLAEDAKRYIWATTSDDNADSLYSIIRLNAGDQQTINRLVDTIRLHEEPQHG